MTGLTATLKQESDSTVSERVVAAIAARERIDALDIDRPLYDAIDPDALDALFLSRQTKGQLTFTYLGYEVAVHSDGEINVNPVDE